MKQKITSAVVFVCIISASQYLSAQNRLAEKIPDSTTLEIIGSFRVDSLKPVSSSSKILVVDSATRKFAAMPLDSLVARIVLQLQNFSDPQMYYAENDSSSVNNGDTLETRLSLSIPAGTYWISAFCEISNDASWTYNDQGVAVTDGTNYYAFSSDLVQENAFSPWSMMKKITIVRQTIFYFQWRAQWIGAPAEIQNARFAAMKVR